MKKIGLYFGTFNPIHKGHLALGNYFTLNTDLDHIWYVVSPQNPFKVNDSLLNDQSRLKMVRLALEDQPNLSASDIEFSLPKPSYTLHTLEHLIQKNPDSQFVLLMGEDNLIRFNQWKKYHQILELIQIYAYPRAYDDYSTKSLISHEKIQLIDGPKLDYSSTEIRKRIKEGKNVKDLMPRASWTFLKQKGFYK